MPIRRAVGSMLVALTLAGCIPEAVPHLSPSPTPRPTAARPRFELATYMYALQTRGKIRIAVLESDAPFAIRDSSGVYAGFEVDLARELASAIFGPQPNPDSVVEWIPVRRDGARAALENGQADVAIARLPVSDELAGALDLTEPYFVTGERILVRGDDSEIKDLGDLDTKTVCVQRDSGVAAHVDDANPFARTLELDTYESCAGALNEGQVDAIGADETILWNLMRTMSNAKIVGRSLTSERYAIGAKRNAADRQGFLPFLNEWLANAVRDGTWGRLYARHIAPLSKETRTSPTP